MPQILKDINDTVGVLTLNNPARRNALSHDLCTELMEALSDFAARKVRVVILRAEKNAKVWCAGHDVTQLRGQGYDPVAHDDFMEQMLRSVQRYPGPVIAMIQGGVWGGGTDLAVTCDLAIGDESASFAMTPAKLGVPYNPAGIVHFMNRVGINIAKEMFFTGAPMKAERAYHCGLLNHLIPADQLEPFTFDLVRTIAANAPLAVAATKEMFRLLSSAHPLDAETFERIQAFRRQAYESADYAEGLAAFAQKRKPRFQGA